MSDADCTPVHEPRSVAASHLVSFLSSYSLTVHFFMALNSLCVDVPLRNYSVTHTSISRKIPNFDVMS